MQSALIIEDDKNSCDYLKLLLHSFPDIQIMGCAANVEEAIKLILQYKPDILFLDVELPDGSGFDILKEIRPYGLIPAVLFITAFDKYAIQAIRYAAFDYLLKPVDPAELNKALLRLRRNEASSSEGKLKILLDQLNNHPKLMFNIRSGAILINPDEIFYCEADGNYTFLYLSGCRKEYITSQIGQVIEKLSSEKFIRLGRSLVINRHHIARIDRIKKQLIFEKNEEQCILELGQRQLRELLTLLE